MKRLKPFFAWAAALAVCPLAAAILSGNGALLPEETAIANQPVVQLIEEGEFATDAEFFATASRPDETAKVLIDGGIGWGETMAFHTWGGGTGTADVVVDLSRDFLVDKVILWSVEDDVRSVESFEVRLSTDGKTFISVGSWQNDDTSVSPKEQLPVPLAYELKASTAARYVELRIRKNPGKFQMVVGEIAVAGSEIPAEADPARYSAVNNRPIPLLTARSLDAGAATLDWSAFAAGITGVKRWHLYELPEAVDHLDTASARLLQSFDAGTTATTLYPLEPGTAYTWALAAEYDDGIQKRIAPTSVTTPVPFQRETFGDMLAINHFWGGGGARQPGRPHGEAWEQVALDLLKETPFKQARWWLAYPAIVAKLYENGIGLCSFPYQQAFEDGLKMGVYTYSAGNEPDISGRPMAEYNDNLKANYALGKKLHPGVTISAPTTGLEERSLIWLEEFYKAGMKEYFDVMDLHTYTKVAADFPVPAGYPPASPEALLTVIPKVRAIMERYGDGDKPMISTEFGFTDSPTANPSGAITPERKAEYLVRGLILHYVLGFRRVYVYSFWDEGDDPNYTEHRFGLVDYDLQKKPAFTASCVLGEMLGACTDFRAIPGVAEPDFGYEFTDPATGSIVAVVWNGAGARSARLKTAPGKVEIVSMLGERTAAQTDADGMFRVRFGTAPIYLRGDAPFEMLEAVNIASEAPRQERLALAAPTAQVALPGADSLEICYTLTNPASHDRTVSVALEMPDGKVVAHKKESVPAQSEFSGAIPFDFQANALERLQLVVGYETEEESCSETCHVFARRLAAQPGVAMIKVSELPHPLLQLVSENLEVTIDPERGGRILELLDRRDGSNQIRLDYDKLSNLPSIPYAYAIWDTLATDDPAQSISREAAYSCRPLPDGAILEARGKDLSLTKEFHLHADELTLDLTVANHGGAPQTFRYQLHPEYTVGGTGDSVSDELTLPIGASPMTIPYWTGLGEKGIAPLTQGWWRVTDRNRGCSLEQNFNLQNFANPRLWFGIGSYNLELESQPRNLAPQQQWHEQLNWKYNQ